MRECVCAGACVKQCVSGVCAFIYARTSCSRARTHARTSQGGEGRTVCLEARRRAARDGASFSSCLVSSECATPRCPARPHLVRERTGRTGVWVRVCARNSQWGEEKGEARGKEGATDSDRDRDRETGTERQKQRQRQRQRIGRDLDRDIHRDRDIHSAQQAHTQAHTHSMQTNRSTCTKSTPPLTTVHPHSHTRARARAHTYKRIPTGGNS